MPDPDGKVLPSTAPETLIVNAGILDAAEISLARTLLACKQGHLFDGWAPPGTDDDRKHQFFDEVAALDQSYAGGLPAYIGRARQLLSASRANVNPLEGWKPAIPEPSCSRSVEPGSDNFFRYEALGLDAAVGLGFVVTAGGLGERLGFRGIKLSLPTEITTGLTQLQFYCSHIVSLQHLLTARLGRTTRLPLAIMTSDDTHLPTIEMLKSNGYFGLSSTQVTCLKQGRVAALKDDHGALARRDFEGNEDPYTVLTKPHGHGDVHALMHASGLARRWEREGVHWLYFIQDSSTTYFCHHLASLGAACDLSLDCCFVATPRAPKMALGILATMVRNTDGKVAPLVPVEYNQIETLLRDGVNAEGGGDVAASDGYSAYPGNSNGILVRIGTYVQTLDDTRGQVAEFVNPKYVDDTRTAFRSPTRLECLMQDLAWSLPEGTRSGYVRYPSTFGYWPCKNDIQTAAALSACNVPAYGAATAEMAVYHMHASLLRALGSSIPLPVERTFHGVVCPLGAAIVLHPSFAPCVSVLHRRLPSAHLIEISRRSTLIVKGRNIVIESLCLDGCLEIDVCEQASLVVRELSVTNEGWRFDELSSAVMASPQCPEVLRMRGYTLRKQGGRRICISSPGAYEIYGGSAEPVKVGPLAADWVQSLHERNDSADTVKGNDEVGGPLLAPNLPPAHATWSTRQLELGPQHSVALPLVLAEPSMVAIDIRPSSTGLVLTLLSDGGRGPPAHPPIQLHPRSNAGGGPSKAHCGGGGGGDESGGASTGRASNGSLELAVNGSGVYILHLRNTNLLTKLALTAACELEPIATRRRAAQCASLAARRAELEAVIGRERELEASEAALAQRLWEVQETRRRHLAMAEQLRQAVAAIEAELAAPLRRKSEL